MGSYSAITRLPIPVATALLAAVSGAAYFFQALLAAALFGPTLNLINVIITLAFILAPAIVVARFNNFRELRGWAKPLVFAAVLIGGFFVWFLVLDVLASTCEGSCYD